jgi:thiamine-monophosphate kinase
MDPALAHLGEFGLIGLIRERMRHRSPGTVLGIGDDAAVLRPEADAEVIATTDMLLEGVHFQRHWGCPRELGRKTLAVNLSDIAAMGGRPQHALLGLGVPPSGVPLAEIEALLAGLEEEAAAYGVALVGGDTCASRSGLVLSVTLLGVVAAGRAILRSGAHPEETVWVTGRLGGSAAGLLALESGLRPDSPWPAGLPRPTWIGPAEEAALQAGLRAHLLPVPRLAIGQALVGCATAMIDVSDGIASDLGHLCTESRVGARIQAGRVPIHPAAAVVGRWLGRDPLDLALRGGEDYELLFTSRADPRPRLLAVAPELEVTALGAVVAEPLGARLETADGREHAMAGGFDHFSAAP